MDVGQETESEGRPQTGGLVNPNKSENDWLVSVRRERARAYFHPANSHIIAWKKAADTTHAS